MYQGDSSARVVSKKRGYAPPEYPDESTEEQSVENDTDLKQQLLDFNPENYNVVSLMFSRVHQ